MTAWKVAVESVVGTSHRASGLPCQDSGDSKLLFGGSVVIAAVSDGAGSARYSQEGSKTAVRATLGYLDSWCTSNARQIAEAPPNQSQAKAIFECVVDSVLLALEDRFKEIAAEQKSTVSLRDLSCTLLAFIATPYWTIAMQIGDGFIVVRPLEEPKYLLLFPPQKGEYVNVTKFVTSRDAKNALSVTTIAKPIIFIAAATDGIERVALDLKTNTAPASFFKSFEDEIKKNSSIQETEDSIRCWLDSPDLRARTDDDKTLLIAVAYESWTPEISVNRSTQVPGTEEVTSLGISMTDHRRRNESERLKDITTSDWLELILLASLKTLGIIAQNGLALSGRLAWLLLGVLLGLAFSPLNKIPEVQQSELALPQSTVIPVPSNSQPQPD